MVARQDDDVEMIDLTELNALRARIDQLEADAAREQAERAEERTTRRGMLRLAGAAAVGGLAAAVAAEPVAAADPNDLVLNTAGNAAISATGIAMTAGTPSFGLGCYESGYGPLNTDLGRPAAFGHANGTAFTVGVAGHQTGPAGAGVLGLDTGSGLAGVGVYGKTSNSSATGVIGESPSATGSLAADGRGLQGYGLAGALLLTPFSSTTPPSRSGDPFALGTLETSSDGSVWFCYEAGSPGKWRKLAGPATGGAFHPITPTRVYDSRAVAPTPGLLTAGNNRLVSVADGRDNNGTVTTPNLVPAGATAVAANITVTGTTGAGGYLAVNPGGVTAVTASTINWFGAGQNLANGVTLTLNATRQLTVVCGDGGGSTHFIIDIAGYYL